MNIFLWSFGLLVFGLFLHVGVWKVRLPRRQMWTLLKLFVGVWLLWAGYALGGLAGCWGMIGPKLGFLEFLHVSMVYGAVSVTYTWLYSLVEIDSPSLRIVMTVAKAGPLGISREELRAKVDLGRFVEARIRALLVDGMVEQRDGRYFATGKGRLPRNVVVFVRGVVGVEQGLG